jgi:hypothetical protein
LEHSTAFDFFAKFQDSFDVKFDAALGRVALRIKHRIGARCFAHQALWHQELGAVRTTCFGQRRMEAVVV